jgi:hypothetical protein
MLGKMARLPSSVFATGHRERAVQAYFIDETIPEVVGRRGMIGVQAKGLQHDFAGAVEHEGGIEVASRELGIAGVGIGRHEHLVLLGHLLKALDLGAGKLDAATQVLLPVAQGFLGEQEQIARRFIQ